MKRWLQEPLLHFLLLGALIFCGYGLLDRRDEGRAGRLTVTRGRIESLRASFSRIRQRPPSPAELDGLIEDYIREEVFAREAIALGLDRDDTVIRRRLRQKLEFIANDLAAQAEPTEAELGGFLSTHPDLFRLEPRFTFRQVYLDSERRGDALRQDAERLLADLDHAGAEVDFRKLGDASLLSPEFQDVPASEVLRVLGAEFARQLALLPEGRWQGPVTSSFGAHLVFVSERSAGRLPELSEIRARVAREWTDARRREDNERFYQKLLQRYEVSIEAPEPAEANEIAEIERR